jgi:octaprenyl-diphosphate synthase
LSDRPSPEGLDVLTLAPELGRMYEPVAGDLVALNTYLAEEFRSTEPFVHDLLIHIARFRGKQIRPAVLFLAGRAVAMAEADARVGHDHVKCGGVVELIHTATLVHDDLLDDARIRRRVETVNHRWGERAAVLLGDFIYSRGFSISTEVEGVARLLADTTHTICEGELLQVGSAGDIDLTEARYNEIIEKKTAVLYGMAARVGASLAGGTPEQVAALERYGTALGMAFQIADDALDILGDEGVVGKSLGTDLVNGKMTLPIIRLRDLLGDAAGQELRWVLENPKETGARARVQKMLDEHEIFRKVRATAEAHIEEAVASLDALPESPARESLTTLARFVLERNL